MITILYFQSAKKTSAPEKLLGVREYAVRNNWHIQVINKSPTNRELRELVDFWSPSGAIADCGGGEYGMRKDVFGRLPVVFLDCNRNEFDARTHMVCHDSLATGRAAARELMLSNCTSFAYVPFPGSFVWSAERGQGFRRALTINGLDCRHFCDPSPNFSVSRQRRLRAFLADLPKPVAVFAANDKTAEEALTAATFAQIKIPSDMILLGVDNFSELCDNTSPTLSSIKPDFKQGGALAAMMLDALIKGKPTPLRLTFGPLQVIRRASTRILSTTDQLVTRALELIEEESCTGLTAAKVCSLFACSRRSAEIRFRKATGSSILERIHAVRLRKIKSFLSNPNQELKPLADFCGYRSPNSLRKFFRKATGQTMSCWQSSANSPAPSVR